MNASVVPVRQPCPVGGGDNLACLPQAKFRVHPPTGTALCTVHLPLPPGRKGLQPCSDLVYCSTNGNGLFGQGWDLPISTFRRAADDPAAVIYSGAGELVRIDDPSASCSIYRPHFEGLFARIEHHRGHDTNHWQVTTSDGLVHCYGCSRSHEAEPGHLPVGTLADPRKPTRIGAWLRTSTRDSFGNRIEYQYQRVRSDAIVYPWEEVLLSTIRYADHGDPGQPCFLVSIRFHYEDRPDVLRDFSLGFETRTSRRCCRIDVVTQADQVHTLRRYHLAYADGPVSLLKEIRTESGDGSERLPPLEFDYSAGALLCRIDNHMGAATSITYRPFSSGTGSPPFPVVAREEVEDTFSGVRRVTEFRYRHQNWDPVEHTFRGFARVDQRTWERNEHGVTDPVEVRTWYHPGVADGPTPGTHRHSGEYWPGDPPVLPGLVAANHCFEPLPIADLQQAARVLAGCVERREVYCLDGGTQQDRPSIVAEFLNGVREASPSQAGHPGFMRLLHGRRWTQWDRGDDPLTRLVFTEDVDAYGQARTRIEIGVPRGCDSSAPAQDREPYLARLTRTEYVQRDDPTGYRVDRVARTTDYEIADDGKSSLFEFLASIRDGSAPRRAIGEKLQYYDGSAFEGLPLRQVGDHGALVRVEKLVLTEELLQEALDSEGSPASHRPPYLMQPHGDWPTEYPQGFRENLSPGAGYSYRDESSGVSRGYYVQAERHCFDFQNEPVGSRGLLLASMDERGNCTHWAYDRYDLFPTERTDPLGLTTRWSYDYRTLQPECVTDVNGNQTLYAYSPLGLLESIARLGKGNDGGDHSNAVPHVRLAYDWTAFDERRQPVSVQTLKDLNRAPDSPPTSSGEILESREYYDGFGRLLQRRIQDGARSHEFPSSARVVVERWYGYDSAGRIAREYCPFVSEGWGIFPDEDARLGKCKVHSYDGLDRLVRTRYPNGSEERWIHGVPELQDPDNFRPTPWEIYHYDRVDNAGRTHPGREPNSAHSWDTPTSYRIDALGRTIEIVERNGPDPDTDWHARRSTHDLDGNVLTQTDALGRVAFQYVVDLEGRCWRSDSLDAGTRLTMWNAAGAKIERADSKGAWTMWAYDRAQRLVGLWARDADNQPVTLRQRLIHGDDVDSGLSLDQARSANLLGQLVRHFDEAGMLDILACDSEGRIQEQIRHVFRDDAPSVVDWQAHEDTLDPLLDPVSYRSSYRYDALGRLREYRSPEDATGNRARAQFQRDARGYLDQVSVDRIPFAQLTHNACGQRTSLVFANGVRIEHRYDPETTCLLHTWVHDVSGSLLQDLKYEYDLAGNVLAIRDALDASRSQTFAYDPLYRLVLAEGREQASRYVEQYRYDIGGNLTRLEHRGETNYVREFTCTVGNRVSSVNVGDETRTYLHDPSGNLVREGESRSFAWNHDNRLRAFRDTRRGETTSAVYGYDATGRRITKRVDWADGNSDIIVSIDGLFQHRRREVKNRVLENTRLSIEDEGRRLGEFFLGEPFPGESSSRVTYFCCDPLETPTLLLDAQGAILAEQERTPYGEACRGNPPAKGIRFTGKEHDVESGMSYHTARYYLPWLGRWASCDPAGAVDGLNLYRYVRGNPVTLHDPTGCWGAGGHYWATYFTSLLTGFEPEEAFRYAFLAWMPDQISELDAIFVQMVNVKDMIRRQHVLYKPSAGEILNFDFPTLQHMIFDDYMRMIHEGFHCLNGRNASKETNYRHKRAKEAYKASEDYPWVFGLALHAFGDSFAHRKINDHTMYDAGWGHAVELVGRDVPNENPEWDRKHEDDGWTYRGGAVDTVDFRPALFTDYVTSLYKLLRDVLKSRKPRMPLHIPGEVFDVAKWGAERVGYNLAKHYSIQIGKAGSDERAGELTCDMAEEWWGKGIIQRANQYDPHREPVPWGVFYLSNPGAKELHFQFDTMESILYMAQRWSGDRGANE